MNKKKPIKRKVKVGKERWREEKTVTKRRCVNPFSTDVFQEFSPMDELESFRDSCADSCGFSVCACLWVRLLCLW